MSKVFSRLRSCLLDFGVVAIASLVVTGLVVGVRQRGWLQGLELSIYDQMSQLQPDQGPDPRLLVVRITEADIQAQVKKKEWPLPDQLLDRLLGQLEQHRPRVIGLDIFRDAPVGSGHDAFMARLKRSNRIVAITKLGGEANNPPISAPQDLPAAQVGFNDVVVDPGGTIRRTLLFAADENNTVHSYFSLVLALRYLADQGILAKPSNINADYMQIKSAVFVPLKPNDGGYVGGDTQGYQLLLDYRSPRRSVQQVSLAQVLKGQLDPDLVNNRIVLIGTTGETGKDFFYTPYSSGRKDDQRMPGVIVHAQVVSQILDAVAGKRRLFWFWPEPIEALWIAGWALLSGLLAWGIRNLLVLVAGEGVALAGLIGLCFWLFQQKGWIPIVPPAIAIAGTGASVVAYSAQQARRQQQMAMRLLGQNTSPEIAETLWQSRETLLKNGKLSGQKLIATLLFTDLRGFSTISENMSPEALLKWLNEYLEELTQAVQAHQGIVNKFTGDGIMAAFGVPIPRQDPQAIAADAQRAVACALAMRERLEQLNTSWLQRGLPSAQMRVGIFTGPVVAGSLGAKERLEYGLIGDSVNIASRLESVDKHRQPDHCRILVAQEALVYLRGQFEVEPWGLLTLKGKEQAVNVFRIIGPGKE